MKMPEQKHAKTHTQIMIIIVIIRITIIIKKQNGNGITKKLESVFKRCVSSHPSITFASHLQHVQQSYEKENHITKKKHTTKPILKVAPC